MNRAKSFGRPLLLIGLFSAGTGLIWHIGHTMFPQGVAVADVPVAAPVSAAIRSHEPPQTPAAAPAPEPENMAGIIKTARGRFIATEPILFNSGSPEMREASYPKLNKIASFLMDHPGIGVEIIGHTDNLGPEPVNQSVSAERAGIVLEYLVSKGVEKFRLRSRGMGSSDPIDTNDTQLGRQANRRIEFRVEDGSPQASE